MIILMKFAILSLLLGVLCVQVVNAGKDKPRNLLNVLKRRRFCFGTDTLKDVVCNLGSRAGISCDSVTVVPTAAGNTVEVKFSMNHECDLSFSCT